MPLQQDGSVTGTENADFLTGAAGSDTLIGLGGNDSLVGEDGDDSLVGGDGDDTLRGGYGDDTLLGGDGNDEIEGLYGNDVIDTGAGNDHVFGRDGDDLIFGRDGDDHLIGSIGTDTIYGGDGNDIMAGSQGNDEIHGGAGNDLAFIGVFEDSDTIYMDDGNDFVDGATAGSSFYADGGAGNDILNAGVGNDTLLGGAGNDQLNGGDGDDVLTGGGDNDIVTGGDGDDVFILLDVPGRVLITDFAANDADDLIDLSQIEGYDTAEAVSAVMTVEQGKTTLTLDVTGGNLVVTIMSHAPLSADHLGLSGVLEGTVVEDADPEVPQDDAPVDGSDEDTLEGGAADDALGDASGDTALRFAIEGPDAGHFAVDAETGEISNLEWFTPSYNQVWDVNGDHIYEVSLVEYDGDGQEVSRGNLELVVTPSGAIWRDADTDEGQTPEEAGDTGADADPAADSADTGTGDGSDTGTGSAEDDDAADEDEGGAAEDGETDEDAVDDDTEAGADTETSHEDESGSTGNEDPSNPADDVDDGHDATDTQAITFALAGEDASIFVIDPTTGDVAYQPWFTPSYDEVWDLDRDHIYEISVVGSDETGTEVSREDLELVVAETGAVWRTAAPDEDASEDNIPAPEDQDATVTVDGSGGTEGLVYALGGQDANIFEIAADTGTVTFQPWFTPSFDEVWDMDRDHIYEISVTGTDDTGADVVRTDLELVVSETDAVWRVAANDHGTEAEDMSGEDLMALLFTPMEAEDDVPADAPENDDMFMDI